MTFWLRHALLPFLLFLGLAVTFERTDWDLQASDAWFDFSAGVWPNKHSWWAEGVIHDGGRDVVGLIALSAWLVWALSWRLERFRPSRRRALYLALVLSLPAAFVGLGKAFSDRHCPWGIKRYNGTAPYTRLFASLPAGVAPGHCFPSSHAATGFSLLGLYFLLRERGRRPALLGLAIGLAAGVLFSFGQLVRGAHFLSHDLWSAAICWFVALILHQAIFRRNLSLYPFPSDQTPSIW